MLEIDDVFFVENGLNRELGEFYFSEHYGSREAIMKRAEYVPKNSDKLSAAMIPEEMYVFCSKDNIQFSTMVLNKYNPNKGQVMEYL